MHGWMINKKHAVDGFIIKVNMVGDPNRNPPLPYVDSSKKKISLIEQKTVSKFLLKAR